MNPKKALEILTQATGQLQANRETHILIQQALDAIKQAIEIKQKEEKK